MKKIFYNLFIISISALLFTACKKDIEMTTLQTGVPPTLTASAASLVITSATAADTVETFTWTPSQYGYSAAVAYTLQIAKGGTNFAAPKDISMGNKTTFKYSGADFNQLAQLLGLPPGSGGQLEVRVKSALSDSLIIYSNKITVNVTPFFVIINYPSLWVPGDYQGWDPGSAPKISSKTGNGIYEGYLNVPAGGTLQFKLTSDPDWNHFAYGWASSTTTGTSVTGTISSAGSAGNLFFPVAGYYVVRANTNTGIMTWGVKKTTWGIIGDAPVASNNWSNDVAMTYDVATKIWSVTTNFVAGKFKFRANGDWSDGTNNFGDTGADLSLEYGGADIAITAGTHTVKLNLSTPGNYTYTIQ